MNLRIYKQAALYLDAPIEHPEYYDLYLAAKRSKMKKRADILEPVEAIESTIEPVLPTKVKNKFKFLRWLRRNKKVLTE